MCYHLYLLLGVLMSGVSPQQHSKEVSIVSSVEEIQSAIASLAPEEYARLREWFIERDWEQWDQQIAADAQASKLDFLMSLANPPSIVFKKKIPRNHRLKQPGPIRLAGCRA